MLVVVLLIGGLSVTAVRGWDPTWNWVESQWRLDVGAPARTAPYPDSIGEPLVRLAAAGDVGTGGPTEWRTAQVMDSLEAQGEYAALLLLGDNVYAAGGDPSMLQATVFDPFAGVLDGPTDLVAALGNHDVEAADGTGQIAALGLPGRWYERTFGPVRVLVLDSTRAADHDQRQWLTSTLAAPTNATWTIAIQHHPPLSAGYHGSHGPSREYLVPFYEAGGVDLVLAGHDHDYQRLAPSKGVNYVVSGAAAKLRNTARADFTVVASSTYSFLELDAYEGRLVVRSVDHNRRLVDSFSLTPPRRSPFDDSSEAWPEDIGSEYETVAVGARVALAGRTSVLPGDVERTIGVEGGPSGACGCNRRHGRTADGGCLRRRPRRHR